MLYWRRSYYEERLKEKVDKLMEKWKQKILLAESFGCAKLS